MISGSIVTYKNDPSMLARTIESYLYSSGNSKLYVIDNSPNESTEQLCRHESIEYIRNPANPGYGRSHNLALSKSIEHSKYHIVLNPDVSFDTSVIPALVRFMEAHKDVGLVMPRVASPSGEQQLLCKLLPTPHHLFARRFLRPFRKVVSKINFEYEMRFTDYKSVVDAPFLSGCFMFIRTEILQRVGLFDERFFLYFEDTDLSRRINQQSRTVYFPHVTINHDHAHNLLQRSSRLVHAIVSGFHYFNKWGWFQDAERESVNHGILKKFNVNGYAGKS